MVPFFRVCCRTRGQRGSYGQETKPRARDPTCVSRLQGRLPLRSCPTRTSTGRKAARRAGHTPCGAMGSRNGVTGSVGRRKPGPAASAYVRSKGGCTERLDDGMKESDDEHQPRGIRRF